MHRLCAHTRIPCARLAFYAAKAMGEGAYITPRFLRDEEARGTRPSWWWRSGPLHRLPVPGLGGLLMRPTCSSPACDNLAERKKKGYRPWCRSCRTRRAGRQHASGALQRRFLRIRSVCRCEACGLSHSDPSFFDVHHRDGNHRNNDVLNLAVVCPNCHREAHLGSRLFVFADALMERLFEVPA